MILTIENISLSNEKKQKIKEIYESSFQKEERIPFLMMIIMGYLKSTCFFSFRDGDTICGFVYMAAIKK